VKGRPKPGRGEPDLSRSNRLLQEALSRHRARGGEPAGRGAPDESQISNLLFRNRARPGGPTTAERTNPPPAPPPPGGGDVQRVTAELHARAVAAEPTLTPLVSGFVEEHGGKMEGLAARLKTPESLARKINADVANDRKTPTEVAAKIFDANRYTGVFPEQNYAQSTQAVLDQLRAEGYTLRVKNFWANDKNPYQGVNVQVTSPDGGQWELQFHTDTSLQVKEGALHQLFEQQRELPPGDPKIPELTAQMAQVAGGIPVPPRVAMIS
jgi:hypothetical protein